MHIDIYARLNIKLIILSSILQIILTPMLYSKVSSAETEAMGSASEVLGGRDFPVDSHSNLADTLDFVFEQFKKGEWGVDNYVYHMSLCMIKPTIWVSDQVGHKPGCTVTE